MNGREDPKSNDLFYLCSLIAHIARKTRNSPAAVVQALGRERVAKIYDLADVYHCEGLDRVADELIAECGLHAGDFDNVTHCPYAVPTCWDVGKVYKRLILRVAQAEGKDVPTALMEVYGSAIVPLIEDYDGSFYYDNPESIFATYENGCVPE